MISNIVIKYMTSFIAKLIKIKVLQSRFTDFRCLLLLFLFRYPVS